MSIGRLERINSLILWVCLLFCFQMKINATHLMGGEVVVTQVGLKNYQVDMVLYRDQQGISMSTSQKYHLFRENGTKVGVFDFDYVSQPSGSQVPNFPYGVEPYYYKDVIDLSAEDEGKFFVVFDHCCRNEAILNLSSPLNESMYLKTEFTIFDNQHNSTPKFLAMPIAYLAVNHPWQYNPVPYDSDGDSLFWYIDAVESATMDPPNLFSNQGFGWQFPFASPINPFSINPNTGVISWTANTLGNFVASVIVEEYRAGKKIGTIRRDMQFVVVPKNGNDVPSVSIVDLSKPDQGTSGNPLPIMPHGSYEISVEAGSPISLQISGEDVNNQGEPLQLECMSGLMDFNAHFNVINTTENIVTAKFDWTPDSSFIGENYILNFRINDGTWSLDKTVLVKVVEKVETENFKLEVFPNPTKGSFMYRLDQGHANFDRIEIFNLLGNLVYAESLEIEEGINQFHLSASPGAYFIKLSGKKHSVTQKLSVIE